MKTFIHILEDLFIQSGSGWQKYIIGKAEYVVKGSFSREYDQVNKKECYMPAVICNVLFDKDSPEMAQMIAWCQDYLANFDALEKEREDKLMPAYEWKLQSLIENGVDLASAIERKLWQKRPDLLSNEEKDALIDEWEASQ